MTMNNNNDNKNNDVDVKINVDVKVNIDKNKKSGAVKEKRTKKGFTVKDVLPDDVMMLLNKEFNLDKKRNNHNHTRKWKYSANNKNRNKFKQNHNGEHKNWKTRSRINSKNNKRAVPDSHADTKTTA